VAADRQDVRGGVARECDEATGDRAGARLGRRRRAVRMQRAYDRRERLAVGLLGGEAGRLTGAQRVGQDESALVRRANSLAKRTASSSRSPTLTAQTTGPPGKGDGEPGRHDDDRAGRLAG
jgi:hypothetical protein